MAIIREDISYPILAKIRFQNLHKIYKTVWLGRFI